jgi:hypothetical protein
MLLKATVVVFGIGLTGSGIVALTQSAGEAVLVASAPEVAAPSGASTAAVDLPNEAFQRAYLQARYTTQHSFSGLHTVYP